MTITLDPIGHVRGGRSELRDDDWGGVQAVIELDPARFTEEALLGLDAFSHAEIIFLFDRVPKDRIETGARHPRGRTDWPRVGIFAQRGKNRPNRIGLTTCEVLRVESTRLYVRELDALDAAPVLDIKPVMSGFAPRGALREPAWARAIMAAYWERSPGAQADPS